MNLAIAAAVFPIIFIGELPDKTMFASLVMSTRGKPLAVWAGAASVFAIHVVIATTIGVALFHVVPHRALEGIVAGMFLVGAGLALREGLRERQYEEREESLVQSEVKIHGRRTFTTAFIVIFLAEWGDLTQILTAEPCSPLPLAFLCGTRSGSRVVVSGGDSRCRWSDTSSSRKCHDRSFRDRGRFDRACRLRGLARHSLSSDGLLDLCRGQYRRRDAEATPSLVTDSLALAVGPRHFEKILLQAGDRRDTFELREFGPQVFLLLQKLQPGQAVSLGELSLHCRQLLPHSRCRPRAPSARPRIFEGFEISANHHPFCPSLS